MRVLVPDTKILFGSDYPFAPEATPASTVKGLSELGLAPDALHRIERENALAIISAF
jgi:predicted TIM-barrel fold metal-dependent hydrolase